MGNFNNLCFIKQGSLQPVFTADIYAADGVTPLNLSSATGAKIRMRSETGTTLVINNASATLSGTNNSHIEYDWVTNDTANAGRFLMEAEIDFTGNNMVVPLYGYWHVIITPVLP